ncbi:GAF domain-containing protein [Limnoglobus roseus]|uniref:GAF domain-containing protein n=1 Tax=Limnoglobus roseus TaxID=2598579 RepID=UPI00143CCDDD|nr:GAF domain-containing protein [Limnoglobus roseus]
MELTEALTRDGIRAALTVLNRTSGHRFTAMYRFGPSRTHNLFFYDRENPDVCEGKDHPIEATYCVYVKEEGGPFLLADATVDERVMLHEAQFKIQAYCGVPLVNTNGTIFGTLCHYDTEPVGVTPAAVELMIYFSALLVRHGHNLSPDGA